MSSIAVAGTLRRPRSPRTCSTRARSSPHPYHRTKFESEKLVRERVEVPWRVYRPAVVVGNSSTGEMDKIDGPYYFFKAIQKLRHALPQWFPLISLELGRTNIVPVDYVAAAVDHIAHQDGLDGQAFHIVDPKPQRSGDVLNTFADSAHAPHARHADRQADDRHAARRACSRYAMKLPALQGIRAASWPTSGSRRRSSIHRADAARFDARDTAARARGHRHRAPAARDLRGQAVGLLGARRSTRTSTRTARFEGAVNGKTVRHHRRVERHRPRRRAQDRRRRRHPDPRRAHAGEARRGQGRDRGRGRHRLRLLRATCPTSTRSTQLVEKMLRRPRARSTSSSTTRAARSGARSRCPTTASTTTSARCSSTTSAPVKLMLGAAAAHARAQAPATSSTSPRSACRRTRRASRAYVALEGGAGRVHARRRARRRSATTSRSRRSTCRSCARR